MGHTRVDGHDENHFDLRGDFVCDCCGRCIRRDGNPCAHAMLMDHLDDFQMFVYMQVKSSDVSERGTRRTGRFIVEGVG